MDRWQHCIRKQRQHLRGWGANVGAALRSRKASLLTAIQELDTLADSPGLTEEDWKMRYSLENDLLFITTCEEIYWRQRGAQNWILRTAYYQAVANGRRRKCQISMLRDCHNVISDPEALSQHIYAFYRELLASGERGGTTLIVTG